jgi:hypothetical protein
MHKRLAISAAPLETICNHPSSHPVVFVAPDGLQRHEAVLLPSLDWSRNVPLKSGCFTYHGAALTVLT